MLLLILLTFNPSYPQNPELINFTHRENNIHSLAGEGDYFRIYLRGKLIKFDNINQVVYNSSENNGGIFPEEFILWQKCPLSSNSDMINEFDMAGVTTIHSEIDDISGAKVKTILTSKFQTERYNCKFNAGQLSGGVGLYKLSTIKSSEEKKIISSNWCFI